MDAATGGDSRLAPESVHVALRPAAKPPEPAVSTVSPIQSTAGEIEEIERLYAEGKISPVEYKKLRERAIEGRR